MTSLILSLSMGLHLLPPSPSFVLQPILCLLGSQLQRLWMELLSLPGQAVQECVAGLAEGNDRLPFLGALQTSPCASCAKVGSAGSYSVWVWYTDPGLCVILQEKEKKPLKEGVQDMLVKHHLFSWDIDG